ncbi:MAG TPA: FHA domain-containing protein [Nostocaceae cyanobacterium]|nr:FHA domain-containing protein [Nostocaceae cyanobacterium]
MQINLSWIDPQTGIRRNQLLLTPIGIGRNSDQIPSRINNNTVSKLIIPDVSIADYHALIYTPNRDIFIVAQNSSNGIRVNGIELNEARLQEGDRIQIGSCEITISLTASSGWVCNRMVGFLFKRRCDRTTPENCPDCNQSYEDDYSYYPGYGRYRYYESYRRNPDFTEADAASFDTESDTDFESNFDAS